MRKSSVLRVGIAAAAIVSLLACGGRGHSTPQVASKPAANKTAPVVAPASVTAPVVGNAADPVPDTTPATADEHLATSWAWFHRGTLGGNHIGAENEVTNRTRFIRAVTGCVSTHANNAPATTPRDCVRAANDAAFLKTAGKDTKVRASRADSLAHFRANFARFCSSAAMLADPTSRLEESCSLNTELRIADAILDNVDFGIPVESEAHPSFMKLRPSALAAACRHTAEQSMADLTRSGARHSDDAPAGEVRIFETLRTCERASTKRFIAALHPTPNLGAESLSESKHELLSALDDASAAETEFAQQLALSGGFGIGVQRQRAAEVADFEEWILSEVVRAGRASSP